MKKHLRLLPQPLRLLVAPLLLTVWLLYTGAGPLPEFSSAPAASTFTNPLLPSGPDPWVIYKDGFYYYTSTTGQNITLRKTRAVTDLQNAEIKIVWRPEPGGFSSRSLWAPELHFLNGKWYVYFAADDGNNTNHRMHVLENASPDPLKGTWVEKGQIKDATNRWAIDGSVFEHSGKLYFMWSGWEGFSNGRQDIYIAPMSNPWTISGERVLLSSPTLAWETVGAVKGQPILVNEGPQILKGKDKLFLIYSASGCWTDAYTLGMLSASPDSDLLDPKSWTKSPEPVFTQSAADSVFAPGHNSFFTSPDGTEDWILYHANPRPGMGCGGGRSPRAQKITWRPDGTPDFGKPISPRTRLPRPAGEQDNTTRFYPITYDASVQAAVPHMNLERELAVKNREQYTFLRLTVGDIPVDNIKSVKLRLVEGPGAPGNTAFKIHEAQGDWNEEEVNWVTKPTVGPAVYGSFDGKISNGEVIDLPLRNLSLRPGKAYNLVLVPTGGSKPTRFYASEEGDGPQLVVEYK